jgi:phenylpropionate dioxygenase-like ring-hydroxylating dioxygenase large terminal subunit
MRSFDEPTLTPFDIGFGTTWPKRETVEDGIALIDAYFSAERFEAEREIFSKVWLFAGRAEQVERPGDWFVTEIEICKASVIIVNDRREGIQAFHNVCLHRGMKLVWEPHGHDALFTCPYHAWSYATDGRLRALPDEKNFPQVCRSEQRLKAVSIDSWAGFLFINLDPDPQQTLEQFLGQISQKLLQAPFEEYPRSASLTSQMDANWKLGNEASGEGYHVSSLHRKSARGWALPADNPHSHSLGWEQVGPHLITTLPSNPDFEIDPKARPIQAFAFTNQAQITSAGGPDGDTPSRGFSDHPDLNRPQAKNWGGDGFFLFPTVQIGVFPNGWWFNSYWPVTIDKARWSARWYFCNPKTRRQRFAQECMMTMYRDVLTEDNFSINGQHQGLASGVLERIYFGYPEILLRHMSGVMQAAVDDRLGVIAEPDRLVAV